MKSLILTVAPRGPRGFFIGRIEGTALCIRANRNPMLAAARSLLLVGADPKTILVLRDFGSQINRITGPIDLIVRKSAKRSDKLRFYDGEAGLDGRRKSRVVRNSGKDDTECR
jgi:hypothetical protein